MGKHQIGLIEAPCFRLSAIPDAELREGYSMMQHLRKHHRLDLGGIKTKATQSYTRSMSCKTIMAVDEMLDRDSMTRSVESYNPQTQRSADLFGIVDAISIDLTSKRTRYIQACGLDWQTHIKKFCDPLFVENARRIAAMPGSLLELWGWQQYPGFTKGGGRAKTMFWYPRVQIITLDFILGQEPPRFVRFWEA